MNGIEYAKKIIQRWQGERGVGASAYLLCQKFDGFYGQATFQGNWNVTPYGTAKIAYNTAKNNGHVYTTDVNDPRVQVGDRVYYSWGNPGHVCLVVGRDGGRTVVTNTANSGDDLGQLGNHVKFSHADSLGLTVLGISRRDGNNSQVTGIELSQFAVVVPPVTTPGDDRINFTTNWAWYTNPTNAVQLKNPNGKEWNGQPYLRGDYDVLGVEGNGAVKIAAKDGSTVWAHPSARSLIYYTSGGSAPAPAPAGKQYVDIPANGQYYYNKYENALNGNYDASQLMYGGSREVVENPGTGPVRVKANDGSLVWVGTRNHPARVR